MFALARYSCKTQTFYTRKTFPIYSMNQRKSYKRQLVNSILNQEQMREMERLTLYTCSIEICISRIALLCVDLIRKVFKWLLTVQTCADKITILRPAYAYLVVFKVVCMQTSAIYICSSKTLHLSHLLPA